MTVVDFDMPFGSMVILLVKWALAAIPATIILFIVVGVLIGTLAAIGGAIGLAGVATRSAVQRSIDNGAPSSGPPFVLTVSPSAAGGVDIQNDGSQEWTGCSLTNQGRGGSVGTLRANGTTHVNMAIAITSQKDVVVHCLKPRDEDARLYLVGF